MLPTATPRRPARSPRAGKGPEPSSAVGRCAGFGRESLRDISQLDVSHAFRPSTTMTAAEEDRCPPISALVVARAAGREAPVAGPVARAAAREAPVAGSVAGAAGRVAAGWAAVPAWGWRKRDATDCGAESRPRSCQDSHHDVAQPGCSAIGPKVRGMPLTARSPRPECAAGTFIRTPSSSGDPLDQCRSADTCAIRVSGWPW